MPRPLMSREITTNTSDTLQPQPSRYLIWGLLLAVILLASAIRIRIRDIPLERDEGEYAYGGQLMLQGFPSDAPLCNIKPGIYAVYAIAQAVFGPTQGGIHLGLLVANLATMYVLFLLTQRLFGSTTAVTTAATFAVLSAGRSVLGFTANREHFVVLPALTGILLLLRATDRRQWGLLLLAALMLGISFVIKVNGAVFIAFAGIVLFFRELKQRPFNWRVFIGKGLVYALAAAAPFGVMCLILRHIGKWETFRIWTFEYSKSYASAMTIEGGIHYFKAIIPHIIRPAFSVWIAAAIGFTALLWDKATRRHRLFVAGFALFSFLAICPGLYFREHYFLLTLPAVALLAGIGASGVYTLLLHRFSRATKLKPLVLVLVLLSYPVYWQRDYFFRMTPTEISRASYGNNPFPEAVEIARFIRENSTPSDQIAVLGSEPEIYFYSKRHSATSHMYMYALMEKQYFSLELQRQVIREIESARPRFLVYVENNTSWLANPLSDRLILDWFRQYRQKHYKLVGVADMIPDIPTVYRWKHRAAGYQPRSDHWLKVFERKDSPLCDLNECAP